MPFEPALTFFKSWFSRDENWDWQSLTLDSYRSMFNRTMEEFASLDTAMSDLNPLREAGAKLLLTQGGSDEIIFPQAVVDYYNQVVEAAGGEQKAESFVRLFVTDGDGHSHVTAGPGVTLATGMIALMRWVECDDAPAMIMAEQADIATRNILATRPVYAWPCKVRYVGGNLADCSSFDVEA